MKLLSIGELERQGAILAIQDGNHGELHPKATEYVESGVPFVMASDIRDGRLLLDTCKRLPKSRTDRLRIGFAKTADVLLTHKGTVGEVAVVPETEGYLMLTPQVTYYRTDQRKLSNRYLAYAFRSPSFQDQLGSVSAQSTRPYIGITAQRHLNVPFWEPLEQHRIASILSAYDDLIENNTRRIAILEEMARRIYEEWFVRFRFPGHENVRMVESELGLVPEGWQWSALKDLADINHRSIKRGKEPKEIVYVDISSVSTGSIDNKAPMSFVDSPGRARRIVKDGDIIWACVRPNRKSYSLILSPEQNLIVSTGFAVLSATSVPWTYLYQLTTTEDFVLYLVNHAKGVAYPAVSAEDFENAKVQRPTDTVLAAFDGITEPMARLSATLQRKNTILRTTRDLLLPKLISGELDVSALPEPVATAA